MSSSRRSPSRRAVLPLLLLGSVVLGGCELNGPSSGDSSPAAEGTGQGGGATGTPGSGVGLGSGTGGAGAGGGASSAGTGQETPSGNPGPSNVGTGSTGGAETSIGLQQDGGNPVDPTAPWSSLCGAGSGCKPGAGLGYGDCNAATPVDSGAPSPPLDCKLAGGDETHPAEAVCLPLGSRSDGQECSRAADCAEGLGCVREPEGARCRPYCCDSPEACPAGAYCRPEPTAESARVKVPVCAPAKPCDLLEDETCCDADGCGRTCTVVRSDGTTACIEPGQGRAGEPCPCRAGFLCAQLTRQCMELCRLTESESTCEGRGTCQAGIDGLPPGIGLCSSGDQRVGSP